MKNRKWLTYTLGTLLTLIALAAVGMAGFRVGMTQNIAFPRMDRTERPAFNQNVDQNNPAGLRGNDFGPRGLDRGHRGMPMAGGLSGLIQFAVLALLVWAGYKLAINSGWRLTRVQNQTPPTARPGMTEAQEDKESE